MYAYLIAVIIGLVILIMVFNGLMKSEPTDSSLKPPGDKPVQNNSPAADEPTPDKSATADSQKIRHAREHTPPA